MVVGKGATLAEAHSMAMADVANVECKELFYRSDIGRKVLD
jgi:phosphoribosylamine-glycine ligase